MTLYSRLARLVSALALPLLFPIAVSAQQPAPTGSIAGRVVDENGAGVANAQIYIDRPAVGTQTRADGAYTLTRVPAGSYTLRARLLGFKPESTSVTVSANAQATADFTMRHDPLQLETMVVTAVPAHMPKYHQLKKELRATLSLGSFSSNWSAANACAHGLCAPSPRATRYSAT